MKNNVIISSVTDHVIQKETYEKPIIEVFEIIVENSFLAASEGFEAPGIGESDFVEGETW